MFVLYLALEKIFEYRFICRDVYLSSAVRLRPNDEEIEVLALQ